MPDVSGTVLERYAHVLQAGKARNSITIDENHIREIERSRSVLTGDRSFNRRDVLEFDATAHTKDDVVDVDHPLELEHESPRSEIDATRRYPAFRREHSRNAKTGPREFHEFRDSRERIRTSLSARCRRPRSLTGTVAIHEAQSMGPGCSPSR